MKCIYWNIRGFANVPSRLALKNLIVNNKPDFVFISEPWMHIEDIPRNWFSRLNLKLFALNTRDNLLPNLQCLCNTNLNPNILHIDDQSVSFSLSDNGKLFAISVVYASTSCYRRRLLWNTLNTLQTQHSLPWNFIGDFMLEQGCFSSHLLSFDNNKVLKIINWIC